MTSAVPMLGLALSVLIGVAVGVAAGRGWQRTGDRSPLHPAYDHGAGI